MKQNLNYSSDVLFDYHYTNACILFHIIRYLGIFKLTFRCTFWLPLYYTSQNKSLKNFCDGLDELASTNAWYFVPHLSSIYGRFELVFGCTFWLLYYTNAWYFVPHYPAFGSILNWSLGVLFDCYYITQMLGVLFHIIQHLGRFWIGLWVYFLIIIILHKCLVFCSTLSSIWADFELVFVYTFLLLYYINVRYFVPHYPAFVAILNWSLDVLFGYY